jgi:hypothetical protein
MKKNYALLSGVLLATSFGFAQNNISQSFIQAERKALPSIETRVDPDMTSKFKLASSKAYGDTLWYEDFNGSAGKFTPVNNNPNSNIWTWNTVYQAGQFSGVVPAINSTTGANGFMSLPADFYNTPIPGTGAVAMDTYFVSDKITITPRNSVEVRYQQYLRYCCSSANDLVLEASTDSTTWITFDAIDGLPSNSSNTGIAQAGRAYTVNISCAVAGASDFWIRFRSEGNSHYFWMIDDIAIAEGPAHDLSLDAYAMEFHTDSFAINPFYNQIPYDLFPALPFGGSIINDGGFDNTNAGLNVSVDNTFDPTGAPGIGNVYVISETVPNLVGPLCDSTLDLLTGAPRFVPTVLGTFAVNYSAIGDSADQVPTNNTASQGFIITDTILTRDDGGFGAGVGPASYVSDNGTPGGTTVGDRFGYILIVESNTSNAMIPTSVSYFVSDDPANIGVEIVPKIWRFDEDSATIDQAFVGEVASSFLPYTVTASDTNSLLTLPITSGSASISGLAPGQYVVGWEVTNLPTGTTFEVYNDGSSALLQPNVSCFLFMGHAPGEGWGWVDVNPAIRLNIAGLPLPTGISNKAAQEASFNVSPNPNNGQFNLNITTERPTAYNLNVRNMLGQSVYTNVLNVNGSTVERLDLTGMEKGVYFVSLENENEKLLKKVVVK